MQNEVGNAQLLKVTLEGAMLLIISREKLYEYVLNQRLQESGFDTVSDGRTHLQLFIETWSQLKQNMEGLMRIKDVIGENNELQKQLNRDNAAYNDQVITRGRLQYLWKSEAVVEPLLLDILKDVFKTPL